MIDFKEPINILKKDIKEVTNLLDDIQVEKYEHSFKISASDLHSKPKNEIREEIKKFFCQINKEVIYSVEILNCNDLEEINNAFLHAKNNKVEKRAYSKFNDRKKNVDNKVLYVGSSKGSNLVTRMRNHFGVGAVTTYSMHLKAWFPQRDTYQIQVNVFQTILPSNEIESFNLLELVEQSLWSYLEPVLGKRSGLL